MKGKSAGAYVLLVSAILSLVAAAAYLVFGLTSQTFAAPIFLLVLAAAAGGIALLVYHGFFADYVPPICAALLAASFVTLMRDSIDDLTAFFVGMGNYFGNADNAGPRVAIAALMLAAGLVTIVGSFLGREKK